VGAGATVTLGPMEAHVWYTLPDEVSDAGLIDSCHALLSAEERERHRRLVLPRNRHEYLVAHALLRVSLSRYADIEPSDWVFRTNPYGCPEIESPRVVPPIRFNLSHTDGLVACICAIDRDVGVDVENAQRRIATDEIAEASFSQEEVRSLQSQPQALRPERFFEIWTLKEAYIKARGMGLSLPLERFSLRIEEGGGIRVGFDPSLGDNAQEWQFVAMRPTARHQLAAAIRRGGGSDLEVRVRKTVPLR
jgi:4'-phosphopantetheinyl transferase